MNDTHYILESIHLQPAAHFQPLNLKLPYNSLSCIVGPCDTGKTTYLRVLGGIDEPEQGELKIFDQKFWELDKQQQRQLRQRACYVLPNTALLSSYNVIRNVMLPAQYHQTNTPDIIEQQAHELLDFLGFSADRDQLPGYLPDFQRRLVAISRCLMLNPDMLFVDEAFAFLDPLSIKQMSQHYVDMREKRDMTLLLATHNLGFAAEYADIIVFMHPNGARVYSDWKDVVNDQDSHIQNYIEACQTNKLNTH